MCSPVDLDPDGEFAATHEFKEDDLAALFDALFGMGEFDF